MMTQMNIKGESKSRNLAEAICRLISMNKLKRDDPILSENQLAARFSLSRVTVRQAIAYLVEDDILYKVKGKGTFVSDPTKIPSDYSVASVQSRTIALISPCISNSYHANIARGMEDAASDKEYHVLFRSTDGLVSKEERAVNDLLRTKVAGIILAPSESTPLPQYLVEASGKFRNIVIINEPIIGIDVDVVSSNDLDGAYVAVKHLIDNGHVRIAHLRGPKNIMNAQSREDGYRKALLESGLAIDERLILGERTFGMDEGYESMKKIMALPVDEHPTAVFAASDNLAWGAYQVAEELDLSIPKDFAIVGYGDLADSARRGLQLSSVRQNGYEIGHKACEILLSRNETLGDSRRSSQKVLISPELIVRSSSRKVDETQKSTIERDSNSNPISTGFVIPAKYKENLSCIS